MMNSIDKTENNMMKNSISVIIPVFNAEVFIDEALDSVSKQIRRPEEIIVVDDGSTDQTATIVHRWSKEQNLKVRLIKQENKGPGAARNTAIQHANSQLIALLDADDVLLPHHLSQLENAFRVHSDIVLCFGDSDDFDSTGIIRKSRLIGTLIEKVEYDEHIDGLRVIRGSAYSSLLPAKYIPTSSTLFLKKAAEDIGLFDETFMNAEDRDFMLRLSRVGRFSYYHLVLSRKRAHTDNLSHTRNLARANYCGLKVLEKMMQHRDELNLNSAEAEQTREALMIATRKFMYISSRLGLASYYRACAYLLSQKQHIHLFFNIKNFIRALFFSVKHWKYS